MYNGKNNPSDLKKGQPFEGSSLAIHIYINGNTPGNNPYSTNAGMHDELQNLIAMGKLRMIYGCQCLC